MNIVHAFVCMWGWNMRDSTSFRSLSLVCLPDNCAVALAGSQSWPERLCYTCLMLNWTIFFYFPFIILTLEHVIFSWTTEFSLFFLATEYWAKKLKRIYLWHVIFFFFVTLNIERRPLGAKRHLVVSWLCSQENLICILSTHDLPSPVFILCAELNPHLLPLAFFFIQKFAGIIHFISIISMKKRNSWKTSMW